MSSRRWTRHKLWTRYKGCPTIPLFVVSGVSSSSNSLGTAYEGGYPDLSPVKVKASVRNAGQMLGTLCNTFLISLNATVRHLHENIAYHFKVPSFTLFYFPEFELPLFTGDDGEELQQSDSTLKQLGIQPQSRFTILKETAMVSEGGLDMSRFIRHLDAQELAIFASYPIYIEEQFENVLSDTEDPVDDQPKDRHKFNEGGPDLPKDTEDTKKSNNDSKPFEKPKTAENPIKRLDQSNPGSFVVCMLTCLESDTVHTSAPPPASPASPASPTSPTSPTLTQTNSTA
jgi:hypothetical protein